MATNGSSSKPSLEREISAPPVVPTVPVTPRQLDTITENKNESAETLTDSKLVEASSPAVGINTGNSLGLKSALDKIGSLGAMPGIARWLPNISNRGPDSGANSPAYPISPEIESENPFTVASSPECAPHPGPPNRRDSIADSSFSLARVRSEDGSVSASGLSEATGSHFRELDERLRLFLQENEPHIRNVPVETISTAPITAAEKLAAPFSFQCAFGWSGDPHELEETPKNKVAFLGKLDEAKNGCTFIHRTLREYQDEINSRKNHKFSVDFLKKQNDAIVTTRHQLDQIEDRIDEVIIEVHGIDDDDEGELLREELTTAYEHVYPWVMRTKRVVYDNHVWYKLNYVMGSHTKPVKVPNKTGKAGPKASAGKLNGLSGSTLNLPLRGSAGNSGAPSTSRA